PRSVGGTEGSVVVEFGLEGGPDLELRYRGSNDLRGRGEKGVCDEHSRVKFVCEGSILGERALLGEVVGEFGWGSEFQRAHAAIEKMVRGARMDFSENPFVKGLGV